MPWEPLTLQERADRAMAVISENFNSKQKVVLYFVLTYFQRYLYVEQG